MAEAQFFVQAFIRFLKQQIELPEFSSDSRESVEVAIQCLENVYEIKSSEDDGACQPEADQNPMNHIDLFEVYRSAYVEVSPERKQEAEVMKNEANRLMKEEKYQEALNTYSKAINLDAMNPVFYCNRAAAYSRLGDYARAAEDSKMALRYDPNYSKAYGRLGLAYSKMYQHQLALDAYQNAIRLEPDNQDYKNNMSVSQQHLEEQRNNPLANLANLANAARLGDLNAAFPPQNMGQVNQFFEAARQMMNSNRNVGFVDMVQQLYDLANREMPPGNQPPPPCTHRQNANKDPTPPPAPPST